MAKDGRYRKHEIAINYVLLDADLEWLHLATTLPELLAWYVKNKAEGAPQVAAFDIHNPATFEGVGLHMWRNSFQIRRLEKMPVFTAAHEDLTSVFLEGDLDAIDPATEQRYIREDELRCPDETTLSITNVIPEVHTGEEDDALA